MALAEWVQLEPEWSRLSAFYAEVRAAQSAADLPQEMWARINNGLTIATNTIARLNKTGDLGRALIAGTLTPGAWASTANSTGRGLEALATEIAANNGPFGRVDPNYTSTGASSSAVGARTWKEIVGDAVGVASQAAAVGGGALIVFLGLLLALKVLK